MKKKRDFIWEYIIFLGVLGVIWIYGIGRLFGPIRFPDEFGYLAHGAEFVGYDWNEVSALHPYYSFGYSALLAILMKLFVDPVMLYRAAVTVNFLFLVLCFPILYRILGNLRVSGVQKGAVCSGTLLYSSFIAYGQTVLPEILLVFLFLAVILCAAEQFASPSWEKLAALTVLSSFLFLVHMRMVGVVLALWFVLVWKAVRKKKGRFSVAVSIFFLAAMTAAGLIYKQYYMGMVYGGKNIRLAVINDFSGQVEKLAGLASFQGLSSLAASFCGKMFYLGSATGGLVYWGILFFVETLVQKDREKRETALFILLSALFHIGLVSVFTINSQRVDNLIYGRYNEPLLPVFLAVGFYRMRSAQKLWKSFFFILCVQSILMFVVNGQIARDGAYGIYRHSIPAVSYALDFSKGHIFLFLRNVYLGGSILGFLITAALSLEKKKRGLLLTCTCFAFFQLVIGMKVCGQMNYEYNRENRSDIELAMALKDVAVLSERYDGQERRVVFLYSEVYGYVDLLQYCMGEVSVHVIRESGLNQGNVEDGDIVAVSRNDVFEEELEAKYHRVEESAHFKIYYNPGPF